MMPGRAYVVYGQRPGATIDLETLGEDQAYRMDGDRSTRPGTRCGRG